MIIDDHHNCNELYNKKFGTNNIQQISISWEVQSGQSDVCIR